MLPLSRYVRFDVGLQLATGCGNPKDCTVSARSRRVSAAAYFRLPAGKLAGLHDLNCGALGSNRDHPKQAVGITVRARGKEELVVCAVRVAILAFVVIAP